MNSFKVKAIYFAIIALSTWGCTDLKVEEIDSVLVESESGAFSGVDPEATLSSAYVDLKDFASQENTYALLEVTSDELLVPTRGTDWGDNGVWRTLHTHNWDPAHKYVLSSWNQLNAHIYRLNQLLAPETKASPAQLAEGKFLRAYNMYLLMDLFGQIPYRDANDGQDVDPVVFLGAEAFDFILKDLTEAMPDLPEIAPGTETIRASKAACHFLLAKLYLNKFIFLNEGQADAADMTKVIENIDAITAEGFQLDEGYFDLFTPNPNTETILWTDADWGPKIWNGLHYYQVVSDNTGGGWNGFSTTADFYAMFEGDADSNTPGSNQEERRGYVPKDGSSKGIGYGFLVGQQYDSTGNPLSTRSGKPLAYTKTYPGLTGNGETDGIRIIKYNPSNGAFTHYYILFRYGDAFLMKIEAILRGGTSSDDPLMLINELRDIRSASPLDEVTLPIVLDERGRELYIEGWRRNDQIRFGTYTSSWTLKDASEPYRTLFPIPATAVTSNPNLEQNPGY